tara:strand:- start:26 stop:388 length:363 start_codon:yes stop_codon:yes gene_type:complete
MAKFERKSGRSSGRRSSGRDSGRGRPRRDSGRSGPSRYTKSGTGQGRSTRRADKVEMHETICDKCAKKCEVPFKPTSSKPVYCSDCFVKDDSSSGGRGKSNSFDQINAKLDKIMKALDIY